VLILFDNNVPRGLARALAGHTVTEARERGWATLKNGDLLNAAEEAGFDVIVTSDKSIKYQQNLEGRKIALVVLTQGRWGPVRRMLAEIAAAVNAAAPGSYAEVLIPFVTTPASGSSGSSV
jgi:predicted nuclease of predicted toxin-antitoxin system